MTSKHIPSIIFLEFESKVRKHKHADINMIERP